MGEWLKPKDFEQTIEGLKAIPAQLIGSPSQLAALAGIEVLGMYVQDNLPFNTDSLIMTRAMLGVGEAIKMRCSMILHDAVKTEEVKAGFMWG
jgi:hypothetical protein